MWIVTGDNDDRVVPSHSLKYAAELQHTAGQVEDQNPILLSVIHNSGHGARVPAAQWLALMAKVTHTKIHKD
jgi:prolyl oligopeptidase